MDVGEHGGTDDGSERREGQALTCCSEKRSRGPSERNRKKERERERESYAAVNDSNSTPIRESAAWDHSNLFNSILGDVLDHVL